MGSTFYPESTGKINKTTVSQRQINAVYALYTIYLYNYNYYNIIYATDRRNVYSL